MKISLIPLIALGVLGACDSQIGENTTTVTATNTTTTTTSMGSSIDLTIAGPQTATAGVAFDLDLSVVDPQGTNITSEVTFDVALEDTSTATIDGTTLTITAAGINTVTVTASWGNYVDQESAIIDIDAGAADTLSFSLDANTITAGSSVNYTATLTDAFGNQLENGPTIYALPLTGVVIGAATITGEIADDYVIYATNGVLQAQELLSVTAGPAISIDLTLSSMFADLGGDITASVVARDDYDNTVSDYALSTLPNTTTIKGDTITFNEEGTYSVTATSNGLSDTESPVLVDSNGPLITVSTPARGEYFPTGNVSVAGNVSDSGTGVDALTINGTTVTVNADGSFAGTVSPTLGANVLNVTATDDAGNIADYVAGFMVGDYAADGADVADAIEVRLDESGIGFLADEALSSFDMATLESQMYAMNPLYYSYSSTDWYCWYNEIIDFSFTGLNYGAMNVILDPKTGFLRVGVTISNLELDFDGYVEECYVSDEFSATISSTLVTVTIDNYFGVDAAGNIVVTGSNPVVTLDNYDLTLYDSWLGDLASLFGFDLESMVYDAIVDALIDTIVDEIPPAIQDALGGIDIDTTFDMVGTTVALTGQVSAIDVDEYGLTLSLDADADGGFVLADIPANPGSVLFNGVSPTYAAGAEIGLGMNIDLLNQILHESWQVGAISMTILNDELGLEPAILGFLFPGATTLDIYAYPLMPPVLSATGSSPPMVLDINELQMDMWGTVDGVYEFLGTIAGHINTELELGLDAGMIVLTLGDTYAITDKINPTSDTVADAEQLEAAFDALLPSLLPSVLGDFELELPEVAGLTLSLSSVDIAGDWLVVEGAID